MSEQTVADSLLSLARSELESGLKNVTKKAAELGFVKVLTEAAVSIGEKFADSWSAIGVKDI